MRCPFCGSTNHQVIDKRAVNRLNEIRRRRRCLKCWSRFTTYEKLSELGLWVVKKDGRKELFQREKLKNGLVKALEKRPGLERIEELVDEIERKLWRKKQSMISSKLIGDMVLSELKKIDSVAYLRFASVYRGFQKPADFAKEIKSLQSVIS